MVLSGISRPVCAVERRADAQDAGEGARREVLAMHHRVPVRTATSLSVPTSMLELMPWFSIASPNNQLSGVPANRTDRQARTCRWRRSRGRCGIGELALAPTAAMVFPRIRSTTSPRPGAAIAVDPSVPPSITSAAGRTWAKVRTSKAASARAASTNNAIAERDFIMAAGS